MPPDTGPTREATVLLSGMILSNTITNFVTNFEAVRRRGVFPEVQIWIRERDELSCARMKQWIEEVLRPLLGPMKVIVEPDPWIPDSGGR